MVQPIQNSRVPEATADGRWIVTDGWLQDTYEAIRMGRARDEAACVREAEGRVPAGSAGGRP